MKSNRVPIVYRVQSFLSSTLSMTDSSTLTAMVWIVLSAVSIIIAIIQIYGLYRFRSISGLIIVQKRYPILIMIEAITAIFICSISIPLLTYIRLWPMILDLNDSEKRYLYFIAFIASTPAAHLMVCIECSRWILISFSLQYLKAIGNDKWKCQIDANLVHTNWYI